MPPFTSGCHIFSKGPLFGITFCHSFLAEQPQNFSKSAFGANVTNLGGNGRRKNAIFCSKCSKKCPITPFLICFFFNLPAAHQFFGKIESV